MISNAAAYYLWPAVWVGGRPPYTEGNVDLSTIDEEVYRVVLHGGIAARVLREGLFIFDFTGCPSGRALDETEGGKPSDFDAVAAVILHRVTVLNAHLACLYTAVGQHQKYALEKMALSPSDLITLKSLDDESGGSGDQRTMALWAARYASTYVTHFPNTSDWRLSSRFLDISIEAVTASFELLRQILEHSNEQAPVLADLYVRSCKAYSDHAYSLSLITAWAVTENLLQRLWSRHIEQNRTRKVNGQDLPFINKGRKDKLTSRDFTASVVSEVLSLADLLPYDLYQALSKVRGDRNNWIHGLQPVSRMAAELAVSVAEQMLGLVEGIELRVPLTSSLSG